VEPELKDLNFEDFQKFYNKLMFTPRVFISWFLNGSKRYAVAKVVVFWFSRCYDFAVLFSVLQECVDVCVLLWSPYGIGQTIIFLPCGFFFLSSFFFLA